MFVSLVFDTCGILKAIRIKSTYKNFGVLQNLINPKLEQKT